MPPPLPLTLRKVPPAYATEPESFVAWCGGIRVGAISHDPHATADEKWRWSVTIVVQAMVPGRWSGRASDRAEAMRLLRKAFDGAGIDLDAARYHQRGVEVQRCFWGLHRSGVSAALRIEIVEGQTTREEIEAAHRAVLRELASSGIDTMQRVSDHRDAWQRALARGDDVTGMVWDRVQIAANAAMSAECIVMLPSPTHR